MTTYDVLVSVSIQPLPEDGGPISSMSSLYHNQHFRISGDKFSDVAPTIDGIYRAIQTVVEGSNGDGD